MNTETQRHGVFSLCIFRKLNNISVSSENLILFSVPLCLCVQLEFHFWCFLATSLSLEV